MDIESILEETLDWRFRSFPTRVGTVTVGTVGRQRWNVLRGDLLLPALVVKEEALDHNIAVMAEFCRNHGVLHCPHVKTPMAPQVAQRQLDAGAWGLSAATVSQARVLRAHGAERILIANEVLDPAALRWLATEMRNDAELEVWCLVDSTTGVDTMRRVLRELDAQRPLPVLLEWGTSGGRAGVRSLSQAQRVVEEVLLTPFLHLAGVEGYEGAVRGPDIEARVRGVAEYLQGMRAAVEQLSTDGAFEGTDEIIVSAGGSVFMDQAVEHLGPPWRVDRPVRTVLRAGSYAFHDSDTLDAESALGARGTDEARLRPSLELWSTVLSRPEPELVVAGFGKRDAALDIRLPVPVAFARDGARCPLAYETSVTALNDQHAFVRVAPRSDLRPGDLLGCDVSHPCTSIDRWRILPVVDVAYTVTSAIVTFF